jgi:hypothetical protein
MPLLPPEGRTDRGCTQGGPAWVAAPALFLQRLASSAIFRAGVTAAAKAGRISLLLLPLLVRARTARFLLCWDLGSGICAAIVFGNI